VSAGDFPRTCSGNYSHDRATRAAGQNRHFEGTPFCRDIKSVFAPLAVRERAVDGDGSTCDC